MQSSATGGDGPGSFECNGCRTRVPSTWIDYDILGYAVCPECGQTQSPWVGGVESDAASFRWANSLQTERGHRTL